MGAGRTELGHLFSLLDSQGGRPKSHGRRTEGSEKSAHPGHPGWRSPDRGVRGTSLARSALPVRESSCFTHTRGKNPVDIGVRKGSWHRDFHLAVLHTHLILVYRDPLLRHTRAGLHVILPGMPWTRDGITV